MTDANPISLGERAAATIRTLLDEQGYDPTEAGLRIAVEQGGCAGLSYRFELADGGDPDDIVSESDGVRVFMDPASEPYVSGSALRLESTAHGTGFTVDNPNATQECGCGLSVR